MTYLRIAAVALTILFATLLIWRPLQGLIDGGMRGGVRESSARRLAAALAAMADEH